MSTSYSVGSAVSSCSLRWSSEPGLPQGATPHYTICVEDVKGPMRGQVFGALVTAAHGPELQVLRSRSPNIGNLQPSWSR